VEMLDAKVPRQNFSILRSFPPNASSPRVGNIPILPTLASNSKTYFVVEPK